MFGIAARLLGLWLVVTALLFGAFQSLAQGPSMLLLGAGKMTAGSSLDAATTAWINAVVAAGGAVSATQQTRVNDLIVSLKAHSLFSSNSRLWLHAGESDAKQATIDIMGLAVATVNGTVTLGAGGYTPGGTASDFLALAAMPSNYTLNAAAFTGYVRTSRTTGQNWATMGATRTDDSSFTNLKPYDLSGNVDFGVNDFANSFNSSTNAQGNWVVNRTNSTTVRLLKNGSLVVSATSNSVAVANTTFYVGGYHSLAGNTNPGTDQVAASGLFGTFSTQNETDFMSDLNAYMTAWSVNVYHHGEEEDWKWLVGAANDNVAWRQAM